MRGYVYTLTDEEGQVLYIGTTSSIGRRLCQHYSKPWWGDVASIAVDLFPTVQMAADVERERIDSVRPVHNERTTDNWNNGWQLRRERQQRRHDAGQRCSEPKCRHCRRVLQQIAS